MTLDDQFTEFMHAHWARLVRGARLLGADESTAEELAQDALVACWAQWKRRERLAVDPAAYAYRSVVNGWSNWHRTRRRRERAVSLVGHQSHRTLELHEGEGFGALDLSSISADQRAVVVCRYHFGFSEAETAATLGIAQGTVKSRHARALEKLRLEHINGQLADEQALGEEHGTR